MFVLRNAARPTLNIQRRTFCIRFSVLDVRCSRERGSAALHLIPETLLMPMRPHALAALVLGNFCFPSFLERTHSDFQIRRLRLNHLIRRIATLSFVAVGSDHENCRASVSDANARCVRGGVLILRQKIAGCSARLQLQQLVRPTAVTRITFQRRARKQSNR